MSGKLVRLYTYKHEAKETIVNTYDAEEWDDFLIVHLSGDPSDEVIEKVVELFNQPEFQEKYKQILILPDGLSIDFYGIEVLDE